jgi:hypothetical protein
MTVYGGWRMADGNKQRSRMRLREIVALAGSATVHRPPSAVHLGAQR